MQAVNIHKCYFRGPWNMYWLRLGEQTCIALALAHAASAPCSAAKVVLPPAPPAA